jgi:uncharacterized membrane protein YccC
MPQRAHLGWTETLTAVLDCAVLAAACLASYVLVTHLLPPLHVASRPDTLIGGLWAVIATIFVIRDSVSQSVSAAVSRMAATSVSFVLCLIYLLFLPSGSWAMAVLIGASVLVVTLVGRAQDAISAAISTAVVMVAAILAPHDAWQQPIFRFLDTIVGMAIGLAATWIALRLIHPRLPQAS